MVPLHQQLLVQVPSGSKPDPPPQVEWCLTMGYQLQLIFHSDTYSRTVHTLTIVTLDFTMFFKFSLGTYWNSLSVLHMPFAMFRFEPSKDSWGNSAAPDLQLVLSCLHRSRRAQGLHMVKVPPLMSWHTGILFLTFHLYKHPHPVFLHHVSCRLQKVLHCVLRLPYFIHHSMHRHINLG